ncbi:MAG: beta-ketoacyl synthase N-terminal-like domain-containing protein [Planctomycetota bacterium]
MTLSDSTATPRVVVAGVGLITPLGQSAWETFAALLQGKRLTDRVDRLEPDTDPVPLVQALGGVSIARHTPTDPTVELAERAVREACTEAGLALPGPGVGAFPGAGTGLPTWLGTSKSAVAAMSDLQGQRSPTGEKQLPTRLLEAVALGPHGYLSHHLAARTGVEVRRHTVAACASSLTALHQARMALLNQQSSIKNQKFALVVTAEAALLPAFIHSYRRLGVLAPLTLDGYRQAPLDESRQGFTLSEVGAAVLLQRLDPGEAPPNGTTSIELVDTAVATEASDLIRPSSSMEALGVVAQQLLGDPRKPTQSHRRIAALHPHAPGTADHDPTELRVLADVLNQRQHPFHEAHANTIPAVYANKGALGHSLGSAGLVSFVLACLAARTGKLPPMPWLKTPMRNAPIPLTPTPKLNATSGRSSGGVSGGAHAIFAAGFGGHVAGALIQRSE